MRIYRDCTKSFPPILHNSECLHLHISAINGTYIVFCVLTMRIPDEITALAAA
jgi:hypothetical protein